MPPHGSYCFAAEAQAVGVARDRPLDRSITNLPQQSLSRLQGYRQMTDAVLLAATIQRGGTLATLDSGLARLVDERQRHSLRVIPV